MRILGIETSCDETAAAVVEASSGKRLAFRVLSNIIASQVKIHAKTGGVVPEVAARAHVEKIIPVVERALKASKSSITKYSAAAHNSVMRRGRGIDAIAVTAGPGLVTSLLVGVEVARTLSWLWKKPVVAVNHLAGHVYANWLPSPQPSPAGRGGIKHNPSPLGRGQGDGNIKFPALCLIVSGGHTELVLMRKHLDFKVIGSTRDDAAGEAFDKVAKMLGLGYPGGPAISALAEKFQITNHKLQTNPKSKTTNSHHQIIQSSNHPIHFPRPMIHQKGDFSAKGGPASGWDFSFSGLKTAVLYFIKTLKHENIKTMLPQICYEFQEAVVDVLVAKTVRAAKKYNVKTVLLGGGVAANARLRQQLSAAIQRHMPSAICHMPSVVYTTDNAAMIAAAGYFMALAKQFTPWQKLDVDPNWKLGTKLNPIPR